MRHLALLGGLLAVAMPIFAQSDRLLAPIDTGSTVVLKGNTNSRAQPRYDQGPMAALRMISGIRLVAKPTAGQQAALNQLLAEQQDPASSNYHNWLTPEQYAERFGLSANDIASITAWLQSQGFSVDYVARARNYAAFSGTAGQVQAVFRTEIHRYQVDGQSHFANATDPSIPAALEPLILAIQGLDDFRPQPQSAKKALPDATMNGAHYLSPGDVATIYNITPLYQQSFNGSGQKLVVAGQTQFNMSDIAAFRAEFSLPVNPPSPVLVPGSADPGVVAADLPEATLDLEYSGGTAPNASVIFVYSSDVWNSVQYAIDQNLAPVISSSYGDCEASVSSDGAFAASLRQSAQQANAQGITWVSASGDDGAADCDYGSGIKEALDGLAVNWPASIPEITGVGGTEFSEAGGTYWSSTNNANGSSALSYIPEMAWNDTTLSISAHDGLASTGGGASILYTKPTWQTGAGVPNDNARDVPDISFSASNEHDPYTVYVSGRNEYYGGTSVSTPVFAGVLAVLNQYLVAKGTQAKAGLGNVNPNLYSLAAPGNNIFHDTTVGNNIVPCEIGTPSCTSGSMGYSAGPGYDQTTGLGSANVNNLVTEWSGQTTVGSDTITLSANPSSILANGTTVLTATVRAVSGSTSPSGTVAFSWGLNALGSATLAGSGGSATASITIYGSVFSAALGKESISAYYEGSGSFAPAAASLALTVTPVTTGSASAVVPSVVPNPVYQQAPDARGFNYFFTVKLTETAGVATTVTGFTAFGTDYSSDIMSYFGSASLPALGTLSANLRATLATSPQNVVFVFSGQDASGAHWTQQITVPFLPKQISAAMSLASAPTTVAETPKGVPGCPAGYQYFYQQLDLQELNGFEVQLTRFLAGGFDLSDSIQYWFGSWRLAPFGSLLAEICWPAPAALPVTYDYELDGIDTNGNNIVVTATTPFVGAVANAGVLSTSRASVSLTPGASGTAQTTIAVNLPAGQPWTVTVFPANPRTTWLLVNPLSGTGPGQITVAAASASLSPGIAQATLVIQAIDTLPQFVQVPVTFTVGASSSVGISAVGNNFSYRPVNAPGMVAVVFGTNLAPAQPPQGISASTVPLPTKLNGVLATVNGIQAPLYYVSSGQINIQIPYETPSGPAILAVNNNGAVASYTFEVGAATPGIAQTATGFVVSGEPDPGKRGLQFDMYITGEGDVTPFLATGAAPVGATPQARLPISVTIAGMPAQIVFNGIPSWSVGATQLNVAVPNDAPTGARELVVTVGGVASPPVTITVD
jgi:uncharacterized protein (TIGR03437 family)